MYASLLVNEFVGIISLRLDGLTQMIRTTMFASYALLNTIARSCHSRYACRI